MGILKRNCNTSREERRDLLNKRREERKKRIASRRENKRLRKCNTVKDQCERCDDKCD